MPQSEVIRAILLEGSPCGLYLVRVEDEVPEGQRLLARGLRELEEQ